MSTWWDKNFEMIKFRNWLGGVNADSRKALFNIVKDYKSVLDCACGICLDWEKYKKEKLDIKYTGVDNCKGLVDEAVGRGIDVVEGDITDLPFGDNSFEIVTGRHILEHLPKFEDAINEMHRVAEKEVVIIFFLPPGEKEHIGKDKNLDNQVHLNTYSKKKIDDFLGDIRHEWIPIKNEMILRIYK